jgi:cytochrome P450
MNTQPGSTGASLFGALDSSSFAENPFPLFEQMRSVGPVVPIESPFGGGSQKAWMVTRLEEAVQVLKDSKRFTVESARVYGEHADRRMARGAGRLISQSMIMVDEPDHRRLRSLVSKAFTPKYIQSLRPSIQQLADELIDGVQAQGHMDIVSDYAFPLPINVISSMLGVPSDSRDIIRRWSDVLAGSASPTASPTNASQAVEEYLLQLIAEKRRNPTDDLISQLVQIEEEGDRLDESELLSMIALLIFAGHETTSNLVSIGTLMLFDHPDQMARLQNDLGLVPSAVEELLRYNGPVFSPAPRFAAEDVELDSQQIHRGDIVLIVLGSANRDETQFNDANDLDIARDLNRHVAFGQGIHICLGAPLARLEGDIAFTTMLRRLPNLHLAVPRESIKWRGGFNLRGLTSLPVAF